MAALLGREVLTKDYETVRIRIAFHPDEERFEVRVDGDPVPFTPTEFHILQALARKPGRVFRRTELLEHATGGVFSDERTVDAHVRTIRQKLGGNADLVETVRGRGYRVKETGS